MPLHLSIKYSTGVFVFLYFFLPAVTLSVAGIFVSAYGVVAQVDKFSEVGELQDEITVKQREVEDLQSRVEELQKNITARRSQSVSLSNQIAILSDRIEQAELEIELASSQIEQTQLEIAQTKAEISQTENKIDDQKARLATFIQEMYKLDRQSDIEIFLLNESLSDFFNQFEATLKLQGSIGDSINDLKIVKQEFKAKESFLYDKEETLVVLKERKEEDKVRLEQQSFARSQLLADTRNSEARFKKQLQEAKAIQIQINADIQSLEKVIRQRLEKQGSEGLKKLAGASSMIRPVPDRGITAYFHDPDYPYRYVFEHPALDLRAPQGTPVKAAAPGFVARAADRGMGYSYVMLIHAGGLSTVYGHVSKIFVQEDEFVNQGDIIALSGGTPGTAGAGRLTTGPHSHFEVRLNGIPVNPLGYVK